MSQFGRVMMIDDIYRRLARTRCMFPSGGRELKDRRKDRDQRAGDGIVSYGQRIVSPRGSFRMAGSTWQHDALVPLAGLIIGVCVEDYWISGVQLWWNRYPEGAAFGHLNADGRHNVYGWGDSQGYEAIYKRELEIYNG